MMKLGIRTGKARTPVETAAEHPTLPERERECGQASGLEGFALMGAGGPYRPRHAADAAAEVPLDSSELPTGPRPGRHQR
jgi:hypothetical protein